MKAKLSAWRHSFDGAQRLTLDVAKRFAAPFTGPDGDLAFLSCWNSSSRSLVVTAFCAAWWMCGASRAAATEASNPTPVSVEDLIPRVVARAKSDAAAAPRYDFTRTKTTTTYRASDEIVSREERVYKTTTRAGKWHSHLVSLNGMPAPTRAVSSPERSDAKPRAKNGKEERDRTGGGDSILSQIGDDVVKRFEFTLVGQETLNGRATWMIGVHPRKNIRIRTTEEEVMARLAGTVWVDQADDEVVKAHIQLQEPLRIGWGGMLGALREFRLDVDRQRMEDGGWINGSTDLWIHFRQLLVAKRIRLQETISDVRSLAPVPLAATLPVDTNGPNALVPGKRTEATPHVPTELR